MKQAGEFRFGTSHTAFGHPGAGGSFVFADPDREVSFAYTPNRLGFHLTNDPGEKALRDALYGCLDAAETTDDGAASVGPDPAGRPGRAFAGPSDRDASAL